MPENIRPAKQVTSVKIYLNHRPLPFIWWKQLDFVKKGLFCPLTTIDSSYWWIFPFFLTECYHLMSNYPPMKIVVPLMIPISKKWEKISRICSVIKSRRYRYKHNQLSDVMCFRLNESPYKLVKLKANSHNSAGWTNSLTKYVSMVRKGILSCVLNAAA